MASAFILLVFFQVFTRYVRPEVLVGGGAMLQDGGLEKSQLNLFLAKEVLEGDHANLQVMNKNVITGKDINRVFDLVESKTAVDQNDKKQDDLALDDVINSPTHNRIRRQADRFAQDDSKIRNERVKRKRNRNDKSDRPKGIGRSSVLNENNRTNDNEMELINGSPSIASSEKDSGDGVTVKESDLKHLHANFDMGNDDNNDEADASSHDDDQIENSNNEDDVWDDEDQEDDGDTNDFNNRNTRYNKKQKKNKNSKNNKKKKNKSSLKKQQKRERKRNKLKNKLYGNNDWMDWQEEHERNLYNSRGRIKKQQKALKSSLKKQQKRERKRNKLKNKLYDTNDWMDWQEEHERNLYNSRGRINKKQKNLKNNFYNPIGRTDQHKRSRSFGNGRNARNLQSRESAGWSPLDARNHGIYY